MLFIGVGDRTNDPAGRQIHVTTGATLLPNTVCAGTVGHGGWVLCNLEGTELFLIESGTSLEIVEIAAYSTQRISTFYSDVSF